MLLVRVRQGGPYGALSRVAFQAITVGWVYSPTVRLRGEQTMVGEYAHPTIEGLFRAEKMGQMLPKRMGDCDDDAKQMG
jgi:hypothetical protein